jgi:hypothetical protein
VDRAVAEIDDGMAAAGKGARDEDGVIVDHNIEIGNPPDAPMLVPAIERVTRRAG